MHGAIAAQVAPTPPRDAVEGRPVGAVRDAEGVGAGEGLEEERVLGDVAGEALLGQRAVADARDERVRQGLRREIGVGRPEVGGEAHAASTAIAQTAVSAATTSVNTA